MPDDEKIIEAMARAMAIAQGHDPDALFPTQRIPEPYWVVYRNDARRQLAAHRAMSKAEDKSCKS